MDLIVIYRTSHPKAPNTFFSSAHGTFYGIDHMLGRKASLSPKKTRERAQINKIRNEKEVTMDTTEIQSLIKDYYKQLYTKKMDNLEEMDKFLERYNLTRLN